MSGEQTEPAIRPPRDEHGNRFIDAHEREAIRKAAERDGSGRPALGAQTARDVFYRAAGVDPGVYVHDEAVAAELRAREEAGQPMGGDVRDQLEAKHSYGNIVTLDFTKQEFDAGAGEYRTVTDYDKLGRYQRRLQIEMSMRNMGPGSGIAMQGPGGQLVGDPEVIARVQAAEREQAEAMALAQARQDAAAARFGGPYNIFGSVQ